MDFTTYLQAFYAKRKNGMQTEDALNYVVYNVAKLDYDEDEDEICNLKAKLALNNIQCEHDE